MTIRIKISLIQICSRIINGTAIILSAKTLRKIFCFSVMLRCLTKLSTCFLYNFVPLNHTSNFREPLAKQYAANNKNGVVGKTGRAIPKIPRNKQIKPAMTNSIFVILKICTTLLKIIKDLNKFLINNLHYVNTVSLH